MIASGIAALLVGSSLGRWPISVQTQTIDMTPSEALPLGGYTARHGVLGMPGEKLTGRIVIFRQRTTQVAVVSFEALTIPESLVREVRAKIPAGVTLFLAATHTHSAPDSQMLNDRMTLSIPGISNYKHRWLEWTANRLADGINSTMAGPAKAALGFEVTERETHGLNRNRRGGPVPDPLLRILSMRSGSALLSTFAAHGTILSEKNDKVSGDWPGEFERRTGTAFLPAAIGDASPVAVSEDQQGVKKYVDDLEAVRGRTRKLGFNLSSGIPGLRVAVAPIHLAEAIPHPNFAKDYGITDGLAKTMVKKFAPESASVTAFSIGRLVVVGIPGEPTAEVGAKIVALGHAAGFRDVWVTSHTNGWIGYILTPSDYAMGGYEATLSFNGPDTAVAVEAACDEGFRALQSSTNK